MSKPTHTLSALALFALSASFAPTTFAAILTVTSTADGNATSANCPGATCRLRDAIAAAASGDSIVFDAALAGQTITLTSGALDIDKNLTIQGPGAKLLTIDGNQQFNEFLVGVGNSNCTVIIAGLTAANSSSYGIGNAANLTMNLVTITGNVQAGIGNIGTLTVNNATISGNGFSGGEGGGIYQFSGTLIVSNSTLSGNQANKGGGIYQEFSTVTVNNSTLSGNQANRGGGIYQQSGGTLTVNNATISGNSAGNIGGGVYLNGSSFTAGNSIIADNVSPFTALSDIHSNVIPSSLGNNIIGVWDNAVIFTTANGDKVGTSAAPLNPLLAPLDNYGGPTQTMPPLVGSPAIDAGNNCVLTANGCGNNNLALTSDQRGTGYARDIGSKVDIGAVEYNTPPSINPASGISIPADGLAHTVTIATVSDAEDGISPGLSALKVTPSALSGVTINNIVNTNGTVTADLTAPKVCGSTAGTGGYTLTVTDRGNLTATTAPLSATVNPLSAVPVISISGANPLTVACNAAFAAPTATAVDSCGNSYPVSSSGLVDTSKNGSYTVTYSANSATSNLPVNVNSCAAIVTYNITVTQPKPLSTQEAGSTIPVKFQLKNTTGVRISDTVAQSLAAACSVKAGLDAATLCATYSVRSHSFQANVKVPKGVSGAHTIVVKALTNSVSVAVKIKKDN